MLRMKSKPISVVDQEIRMLALDMIETMYYANGIGLSAVQVGVLKRLFVCEIPEYHDAPFVLINPVIKLSAAKNAAYKEGCLSIPHVQIEIERSKTVVIEYLDLDGKPRTLTESELPAICLQHEIDHLDGKLIIDKLISEEQRNQLVLQMQDFEYSKALINLVPVVKR